MKLCLYDPKYGYYTTRNPLGTQGDFLTAPETSQLFGEMIGVAFLDLWQRMSRPPIHMIEMGPGQGTLMQDLWRILPEAFREKITLHLVEVSPTLRQAQQSRLQGVPVQWHEELDSALQMSRGPTFFLANELLDAFPIQQQIQIEGIWHERQIVMDAATNSLRFEKEGEEGLIRESCPQAINLIQALDAHVGKWQGMALIIDYGYIGPLTGDTFQALKQHSYVHVLDTPGECDLTAHVDFGALIQEIQLCQVNGPTTQSAFLQELGIRLRAEQLLLKATPAQTSHLHKALHRLLDASQMGNLFKAMAITGPQTPIPVGFSTCIQANP